MIPGPLAVAGVAAAIRYEIDGRTYGPRSQEWTARYRGAPPPGLRDRFTPLQPGAVGHRDGVLPGPADWGTLERQNGAREWTEGRHQPVSLTEFDG